MVNRTNTRRTRRIACAVPGRAEGPRGPIRGTVRSLSQGGLFLSGVTLPVGKSVELSLDLPGGNKVQAIAEVRYHSTSAEGAGMGVRFTRIEQGHLAAIDQFVASQAA